MRSLTFKAEDLRDVSKVASSLFDMMLPDVIPDVRQLF